ncbi:MAG TPA: malonyl-ACP O-methyltransferase BioC [Gammaproteobacteria bacterium]|nr:malonyl-ACP O-methyltransferase BioC [Gammaproteobacteria bacterium]
MDEFTLDRQQLRAAFERAARGYDAAAALQQEVARRLLERLELTTIRPARVLDLGCGTGRSLRELRRRYPRARLVAADFAFNMLLAVRRRLGFWRRVPLTCADALHLPFAAGAFDLVYCNLVLQWCDDLDQALAELRRTLAPHALLLFSSFGPDTLKELRAAWREVDDFNHVNRFIDMHDVGDALIRAGFVEPVMDVENLTLTYANVQALAQDLKAIGAHNVTAGRPRGLGGRRRAGKLAAAYERFRRDGRLPATYEVVYGTAWTPAYLPAGMLTAAERDAALHAHQGER